MKAPAARSLRGRLAVLYAALLVVSLVLVGTYSYWNIWQLFISSKSSHLRARAKPVIAHWLAATGLADSPARFPELDRRDLRALARDLTSRDAVAVVVDRDGRVLATGKRLPEEPSSPPPDPKQLRRALAGDNEVTYRGRVDGDPVLVVLIPLRPRPAGPQIMAVVQISAPLTDINRILFRHGATLIALLAVILILGTAAGFWLIGLSLKDLRHLLTACDQVSRGNLAQRVDPVGRRDEIGRLTEAFNRMTSQLEAAFASQQRFVANAAHELLTPLTGLRGSLEVLLRGAQDDPAAAARLLRGMYGELSRLIRLCDRLLGLSRLEGAAHVQRRPVVLPEFMEAFRVQSESLAAGNPLVIETGPDVTVSADPDLLKQVLLNLLSNALRFSAPGSPVTIGWKLLPRAVEIRVSDRGAGMDERTRDRAFEPFFRGKNAPAAGEKGAGLGLALSRSMVAAHGGEMRIESAPGRGTTVFFTLPLD